MKLFKKKTSSRITRVYIDLQGQYHKEKFNRDLRNKSIINDRLTNEQIEEIKCWVGREEKPYPILYEIRRLLNENPQLLSKIISLEIKIREL